MRAITTIMLMLMLLWPAITDAHEIRPASLKITESADLKVYDIIWKTPILEGRRMTIRPVLPSDCQERAIGPGEVRNATHTEHWLATCGPGGLEGQTITISGLSRTLTDVFVEVVAAGGASSSFIITPQHPSFVIGSEAGASAPALDFTGYFELGLKHLLTGIDHILFVTGLVFLIRAPWVLLKVITSFTVAHSLTLGLSTLGLVSLPQGVVESAIALSIVILGVELVKSLDRAADDPSLLLRYPWVLTFVFGLLHGFGFASALTQIGLPESSTALALLFFNLGVEAGQILIVGLVLVALLFARQPIANMAPTLRSAVRSVPGYLIGIPASFWFFERTLKLF